MESTQNNPLHPDTDPALIQVLESAARLQELVPDMVLVGGSAAAMYAHHRLSFDHDHVHRELQDRFDLILDALEREGDWVTNRVVPGKIVLGQLGEIEAGVRQLIRTRPLEATDVELPSGRTVRVPTIEETLRIKAFLIIKRNQTRDYLDVAALSSTIGIAQAAAILRSIDDFYSAAEGAADGEDASVSSQVARQLAHPRPADSRTVRDLAHYKGLTPPWQDWDALTRVTKQLAAAMVEGSQ